METQKNGTISIYATIYCEKASHKGIIIGKGGAMLKKIGELARRDLERDLGAKVYLDLVAQGQGGLAQQPVPNAQFRLSG